MPEDEITTVNNIYNNTIHTSGSTMGNTVLIAFTIVQVIVFIVNSLMKLNLPVEQLWFPLILFMAVFCIGLYSQCR